MSDLTCKQLRAAIPNGSSLGDVQDIEPNLEKIVSPSVSMAIFQVDLGYPITECLDFWGLRMTEVVVNSNQIVTTNKPTPGFLQVRCPFRRPTNSFGSLKGNLIFFSGKNTPTKFFFCVLADVAPTQREKMSATLSGQNVGLIFVADKRASVKSALVLGWVTAFGQVNHLAT